MGSVGTGAKNLWDSAQKDTNRLMNDPLGAITDGVLNYFTFGLVGFDENGNVSGGRLTDALDEGFGEVTGRNMSREQAYENNKRIDAENVAREQERKDQLTQKEAEDRSASFMAQAIRNTSMSRSRSLLGAGANSDEKDFLGL